MKKILITGGYGNLGSWFLRKFSDEYDVFVLARTKRALTFDTDHTLIICDISSEKECRDKLGGFQFDNIIHTASANDFFVENYSEISLNVNGLGTRNILEVIDTSKLENFIYLSTFHVYGENSGKISEETLCSPKNDYGLTHLFAEEYVKMYGYTRSIPYTIFRLTNSYGCPTDKDSSKWYLLFNDICKQAVKENKITLNSNGKPSRDFIWMGDVCEEIYNCIQEDGYEKNNTYNLSSEKSYSVLDIAKLVKQAYHDFSKNNIVIETNKNDVNDYENNLLVSSEKLRKISRLEPQNNFREEAMNIFNLLK